MLKLNDIHNIEDVDKNMDTIHFKGSFIRNKQFMKGGTLLFEDDKLSTFNIDNLY